MQSSLAKGVSAGDPRVMGRVLRSLASLRRKMEPEAPRSAVCAGSLCPLALKPLEVLKALLEEFVDASRASKAGHETAAGIIVCPFVSAPWRAVVTKAARPASVKSNTSLLDLH